MVALMLVGGACAFAFVLLQFGARHLYGYAITSQHVEVRLAGAIVVYRSSLRSIESATLWKASLTDLAAGFTTLRLGNRLVGPAIVIKRRGFPGRIIVTPDEPQAFLETLRANIARARE